MGKNAFAHNLCRVVWDSSNPGGFPTYLLPTKNHIPIYPVFWEVAVPLVKGSVLYVGVLCVDSVPFSASLLLSSYLGIISH